MLYIVRKIDFFFRPTFNYSMRIVAATNSTLASVNMTGYVEIGFLNKQNFGYMRFVFFKR